MSWRSPFLIRCLIVVGLLGAGYCSLTRSFAAALFKSDPVAALAVSSDDARITAGAAQVLMERAQTAGDRRQAEQFARRAMARDGTAVPAATALGFFEGVSGNEKLGESWFSYSERLSRRDLRTQLYFIERFVSEGNVERALHHYDTALRTSSEGAPKLLFPVLRGAIADTPIRHALAETLAGRPIWSENFITDLVEKGPDFAAAAQLLIEARRLGAVVPPVLEETLLNNMVAKGQILEAWRYYIARHAAAGQQLLRNGNFGSDRVGNSPFDWQLTAGDGVVASLGSGDDGQGLEYRVSPTIDATVARQTTLLAAGKYRLQSSMRASAQPMGVGPYWAITCPDGRATVALELGGPIAESKRFFADFVIPSNCETQSLGLVVRASDDIQGATGLIGSVSITRIQ